MASIVLGCFRIVGPMPIQFVRVKQGLMDLGSSSHPDVDRFPDSWDVSGRSGTLNVFASGCARGQPWASCWRYPIDD